MDINNYLKIREAGGMALKVFDGTLVIRLRQFDPNTGQEKEPQTQAIPLKQMLDQVDEQLKVLQAQMDSLTAFKADCVKADKESTS